jgi:hypothetical protein
VRDREAALEVCQAVGTGAALLSLASAAVEFAIGVDWLGIVVFGVLATIAIAAAVMILALQKGWFRKYFEKNAGENLASNGDKEPDHNTP